MNTALHITAEQQAALRAWLKLLNTSNHIRKDLQARLQARHGISLSRFDVLANLYRAPKEGVRLSSLSKQLMVSNGNVTQVLTPLIREGLVERIACSDDGRVANAHLTAAGRHLFETMATDHAGWVEALFAGLNPADQAALGALLGKLDTLRRPQNHKDLTDGPEKIKTQTFPVVLQGRSSHRYPEPAGTHEPADL